MAIVPIWGRNRGERFRSTFWPGPRMPRQPVFPAIGRPARPVTAIWIVCPGRTVLGVTVSLAGVGVAWGSSGAASAVAPNATSRRDASRTTAAQREPIPVPPLRRGIRGRESLAALKARDRDAPDCRRPGCVSRLDPPQSVADSPERRCRRRQRCAGHLAPLARPGRQYQPAVAWILAAS